MTGSGSEAVRELVEIFSEETPLALSQLREDIDRRHVQGISIAAMQLGRACQNFGAERMQNLCSSLQTAGKSGEFTVAAELVDRLEAEFEIVENDAGRFREVGCGLEQLGAETFRRFNPGRRPCDKLPVVVHSDPAG